MDPTSGFRAGGPASREHTPSLGALFRTLSADAAMLVRHEAALAKAELRRSVRRVAAHAGQLVLGASIAAAGGLVLLAALVAGLGKALGERYWLSALLVGGVFLALGGVLALVGMKRAKKTSLAPEETLETLRETGDWAKGEVSELRAALARPAAFDGGSNGGAAWIGHPPAALPRPAPSDGHARGSDGVDGARALDRDRSADRSKPERARKDRTDNDRGTDARTETARSGPPLSMPLWKRVAKESKDDDLSNQAAKVAYYFFLSLPPLVMALFAMAGLFGDERTAAWLTGQLQGALPAEASALVEGFVDDVVREEHPGPLSVGLLLALWAGSAVFTALEDTLNDVFEIREERGFLKGRLVAVGTLVAVGLLFVAGSSAILAGPAVSRALGLEDFGRAVWAVAQWPLAFALIVGAFLVIYYVLPNRPQRGKVRVLAKGAAVGAALWVAATLGFRLYITNFSSYSETYGLLGTVIVLLLWMYVTSLVILLGGEVASEMERTA